MKSDPESLRRLGSAALARTTAQHKEEVGRKRREAAIELAPKVDTMILNIEKQVTAIVKSNKLLQYIQSNPHLTHYRLMRSSGDGQRDQQESCWTFLFCTLCCCGVDMTVERSRHDELYKVVKAAVLKMNKTGNKPQQMAITLTEWKRSGEECFMFHLAFDWSENPVIIQTL